MAKKKIPYKIHKTPFVVIFLFILIWIAGVVSGVAELLKHPTDKTEWNLGATISNSSEIHIIPLTVTLL